MGILEEAEGFVRKRRPFVRKIVNAESDSRIDIADVECVIYFRVIGPHRRDIPFGCVIVGQDLHKSADPDSRDAGRPAILDPGNAG